MKVYFRSFLIALFFFGQLMHAAQYEQLLPTTNTTTFDTSITIYRAIDNEDISMLATMLKDEQSKRDIEILGHATLQRAIFSKKKTSFDFLINSNCCDINKYEKDHLREWSKNWYQPSLSREKFTLLETIDQNWPFLGTWNEWSKVFIILRDKKASGVLNGQGYVGKEMEKIAPPCDTINAFVCRIMTFLIM